jgi:hypothetical protein
VLQPAADALNFGPYCFFGSLDEEIRFFDRFNSVSGTPGGVLLAACSGALLEFCDVPDLAASTVRRGWTTETFVRSRVLHCCAVAGKPTSS